MKANVNDLIALGHIIDSFDGFSADYRNLIVINGGVDTENILSRVNGLKTVKKGFFDSKATKTIKDFYLKHKLEIEIINKYSNLHDFLRRSYDFYFFYQYFLNNRDELDHILALLERIKELNIVDLEFDEMANFMNTEYMAYTKFSLNSKFEYLENMVIVSNYEKDVVKYRTLGSNYKIILEPPYLFRNLLNWHKIVVNSLLFDVKRLPESLSEDVVFAEINQFLKNESDKWDDVRHKIDTSVNLSIASDELMDGFNNIDRVINGLDVAENKEELLTILFKIKEGLVELCEASAEYDDSICENNPLVTKEHIEEAKIKRLRRNFFNSAFN